MLLAYSGLDLCNNIVVCELEDYNIHIIADILAFSLSIYLRGRSLSVYISEYDFSLSVYLESKNLVHVQFYRTTRN